ncbi:hypothetical protein Tco_0859749 [Tanacetum coccineum]|uniref:Tf2-1-like SH3-like domain-containing protein n=1 Tax=Tanacetum coccineum TaxID=301880 RepID=A0ABQ5BF63_9ASTR
MLKVSPWKGVIRFGKKGKLAPRYVGPFEILERIGPVAYRLRLPKELSGVHDTFHVSNLKKCLADASLHVPLDEIKVDKTLRFVEEPVEIMDREVKRLKCNGLEVRSLGLQFLFDELRDRVVNDVVTQLKVFNEFPQRRARFRFVLVFVEAAKQSDLVPEATSVAKSRYRLAPLEMQELSEQLRELQDKVGDGLSRKERVKSRRVRGMILAAQSEVFKQENVLAERLHGLDPHMERKRDESVYFIDRIWVLLVGSVMDEAHASRSQTLEDIIRASVIDLGGSYHLSIWCASFEALYGRKCSLHVPLDEIKVCKTLRFVEEPVENSDREVKRLKCSRIMVVKAKLLAVRYLVKVSWNSKGNFELTWVWEDYLKDKFGNQSIERDRLIGIGLVMDLVKFLSFTFGGKEMTFVVLAFLR